MHRLLKRHDRYIDETISRMADIVREGLPHLTDAQLLETKLTPLQELVISYERK